MAYAKNNHLPLIESRVFGGREEINLLVHVCHSISLFSFIIFFYYYFFSLSACFCVVILS